MTRDFLLVIYVNSSPVLYHFQHMPRQWPRITAFHTPPLMPPLKVQ